MFKFDVYRAGKKVIAVTHCGSRSFRGVAKCAENDAFDFEKGLALANARCRIKALSYLLSEDENDAQKIKAQIKKLQSTLNKINGRDERHFKELCEAKVDLRNALHAVNEYGGED